MINDGPHSNSPLSLTHAGNGFFMRRGYAVAWLAWEGDMLPGDGRMVLDVPVASDHYSYAEMTSLAVGVARSVAQTLAAQPASPHCPGSPGC